MNKEGVEDGEISLYVRMLELNVNENSTKMVSVNIRKLDESQLAWEAKLYRGNATATR